MVRVLNVVWMIILLAVFACDSNSTKPADKMQTSRLTFLDSSNGLPTTGRWRQSIAFYDLNGDGHIDILAPPPRLGPEKYRGPVVWYGNGGGEWSESLLDVPTDLPYDYGDITASDFNGDGIPDIALAMHGLGLKALKGKGKGKYEDMSTGIPSRKDFLSRALVSADFNNDGVSDIAAVSEGQLRGGSPVHGGMLVCYRLGDVWKCNPIGDPNETITIYADQLVVGDVNGDGNRDIAIACRNHRKALIVWIGDGKGGFTPFNKGLPKEKHYLNVAFGDINKDGKDDLIASVSGFDKTSLGVKAFLSGSEGFKEVSEGLPSGEVVYAVSAGDLDGDGVSEIIVGTGAGELKIFSRKGDRWYEVSVSGLPDKLLSRIWNVYCVDLNADGRKDIAVNYGGEKAGGIHVFFNMPSNKD